MVEAQGNEMQTSATSSSSEVFCGVAAGSGGSSEDSSRVMSEKVQMLASSIYKELELMIQKCGEENVKSLMPLVVNVLESLDLAYLEKEEYSVDLEMLKEDNEQLVTQYEREKQLRRAQDQKCIEIEDALVEQNRELESKIESLESIMRMLELKAKNASDHATRLEEREADQKAEFDKLHERYNVLLRTHIDHMERTKYLMGSDKFDMMQSMPIPSQQFRTKMGMATSVDAQTIRGVSDIISAHMSQSTTMDVNLANHISNEDWQDEFGQSATEILQPAQGPLVAESPRAESESVPETGTVAPSQEEDPSAEDPGDSLGADLTGMGREVENLIKENNELLETKNALNIVKNDLIARVDELSSEQDILRDEIRSLEMVRTKMNERIKELETEVKSLKEQSESKDGSQDEVQSAERKRFTRVEMSKVVGERNYYKEKLMELQEAVKWTELQRAKKLHAISSKKRSSIWEFFSGLFTHESVPSRNVHQQVCRSYGVNDSCQKKVAKNADFLDPDYASERRAAERRQQYKIVKEHMAKRDDGRQQACGWSIPVDVSNKDNTCIPIPVFCRPLNDVESHLKLSCAAGVILRGGRNRDGVYICDDKVRSEPSLVKVESPSTEKPASGPKDKEMLRWESSSLLWVCNSSQGNSTITILDVYNPNGVIDTFATCSSHLLCISSIPGVLEAHQTFDDEEWKRFVRGGGGVRDVPPDLHDHDEFGAVTWVELRKLVSDEDPTPTYCGPNQVPSPTRARDFSECEASAVTASTSGDEGLNSVGSLLSSNKQILNNLSLRPIIENEFKKYEGVSDDLTALPTMWIGSQNGYIFIHSSVFEWRNCLRRIKLPDAVLCILYHNGRVFVALANGTVAVFHRNKEGGWSEAGYHIITIGRETSSVRSLSIVDDRVWAAYRNCIIIINAEDLVVQKAFVAHPRRDSQVRHMQWVGDGVWVSIRLDSTLRLYHAYSHEHLQDIDIEPYVTKMLGTNKLDFSYVRTTALLVTCRRLWVGTGTGVVITIPLTEASTGNDACMDSKSMSFYQNGCGDVKGPGGLIRVYGDHLTDRHLPGSFIPYCSMTQAQLSFHGHKDSVKFFLSFPGSEPAKTVGPKSPKTLVVSGGDGYIDFRMGEEDEQINPRGGIRQRDLSYLIVWETDSPPKKNTSQ